VRDIESGKVRATRELFRVDQDHIPRANDRRRPQRTTPTRRVAPLCIQLGYPPSFRVTPARMRIIIPP